jgi:Short C-terminal domain
MRAAMVGGAGYAVGRRAARRAEGPAQADSPPSQPPPAAQAPASSEVDRIEALTKLKGLLDSGVLTEEQYEAEKQKLLQGA